MPAKIPPVVGQIKCTMCKQRIDVIRYDDDLRTASHLNEDNIICSYGHTLLAHTLPKLYSRRNDGSIHVWRIQRVDDRYRTIAGLINGARVKSEWTVCTSKNEGRSNETTPSTQAFREAVSLWQRKIDKGYSPFLADIDTCVKFFKPMLAKKYANYKDTLSYPVYVQPKLDGMRCVARKDGLWSRRGKPIISAPHIYKALSPVWDKYPDLVFDGELYNHEYHDDFDKIISMSRKGKPTPEALKMSAKYLQYHVYDLFDEQDPKRVFSDRIELLTIALMDKADIRPIRFVKTVRVDLPQQIDTLHEEMFQEGYEGCMVRQNKEYKNCRTPYLLKYKNCNEKEFEIVDVVEGDGNRSGMAGRVVLVMKNGETFKASIMGGVKLYKHMLQNKEEYIGQKATIIYQNLTPKGKPRFPRMKCVRNYE